MAEKTVELAERIARVAHDGQFDKAGQPYIEHVERVAAAVEGDDAKAVAWLHDVLEDTEVGRDGQGYLRLLAAGMPNGIVREVDALTRESGFYFDYIQRIARRGGIAARVKLADLRDNLRPGAPTLRQRYEKAIAMLEAQQVEERG